MRFSGCKDKRFPLRIYSDIPFSFIGNGVAERVGTGGGSDGVGRERYAHLRRLRSDADAGRGAPCRMVGR